MKINRLLVLVLLFFFFDLSTHAVYAANVPERAGVVTDTAGLFTADQVKQLREALQGQSFELDVVTAQGLDAEAVQQFGNDVYNAWKLGANQLLLVVGDKPGTVQLVYDNEQVAKAVSGSEAGNAQGIIDLHYSPLAAKGKMAEGIKAVSSYVNGLNVPITKEPSSQTVPNGAGTSPVQPATPGGAAGSVAQTVPNVETPTPAAAESGSSSPQGHSGGAGAMGGASSNPSSSRASMMAAIVGGVLLLVVIAVRYRLKRSRSER